MASLRNILFAAYSLSSLAYAAPLKEDLEGRSTNLLCLLENPIVSVLGAKASATAFCSSYLSIATQTFSATVTTATSTSTTTTILTGTQVITDPTSTSTEVSTITTTAIVFTTSDDTASPTALKRGVSSGKSNNGLEIPAVLTNFAAPVLSSACSCLSIPTPSVTNTKTVTTTVSLTSTTSTFAGTTTYTPVAYTTTTATDTATSTSTILKSDVLSTIAAVVNQDGYQSFCSSILTYTTPVTTAYQTTTATIAVTASSTVTLTSYTTATTTVIQGAAKRQASDEGAATYATAAATTNGTPVELATYPADYVMSACSMAVTSPATSTISSTVTVTATQTSIQLATVTAQATSVVTVTCAKYPVSNSGFETGTFSGWSYYNPIGGAGGSWSIVSGGYASSYAAQVKMLNPDTSKYGGFGGYITQTVSTCVGLTYTVSFNYDCTVVDNGLAIYAWAGTGNSGQFSCPSAGSWYSKSFTFTAGSTSTAIYIEGVQNGITQGIISFDNVVVTLNQ